MADGEAVIRLDADVSAYINKVVRASKETKNAASGLQDSAGKWLETNLKGVASLATALVLVREMGMAAKTYSENMAKASESGGKQAVTEAQVMGRIGVGRGAARGLLNDDKALATRDQKLDFLSQVASVQEERRAKYQPQLKAQEVEAMATMFSQGGEAAWGKGGSGLVKAVQNMPGGVPVAQSLKRELAGRLNLKPEAAARMSLDEMNARYMKTIPQDALEEQGAAAEEDSLQQETQADAAEKGRRARLLAARKKRREFEHPGIGMTKGVLKHVGIPFTDIDLGGAVEAGENISEAIGASEEASYRDLTKQTSTLNRPSQDTSILKSIDASLKQVLKPNLPNLKSRGEKNP